MSESELAKLLREAARLSTQSAELADSNPEEAFALEDRAAALRKRARRLYRAGLPSIESRDLGPRIRPPVVLESLPPVESPQHPGRSRSGGLSTRDAVVSSLGELAVPSAPRDVAEYSEARFGLRPDQGTLASLRRDERRAWESPSSSRPVWVVPALDGWRFLPVRAKLALSSWPLEIRLLGPQSERVDYLTAASNIAQQCVRLAEHDEALAQRVARVLDRYAAAMPGVHVHGRGADPRRVLQTANAELEVIGASDRTWRREAAGRAEAKLSEPEKLWGATSPMLLEGGQRVEDQALLEEGRESLKDRHS